MLEAAMLSELGMGILETFYMVLTSTALAYVLGIPIGIVLYITDDNGICACKPVSVILGIIVNLMRSIPFIILLVAILPFSSHLSETVI